MQVVRKKALDYRLKENKNIENSKQKIVN